MNTAIADISLQTIILIWIEQAQKMHSILGNSFKSTEGIQSSFARFTYKIHGMIDTVVICHRYDFNADFFTGFDYRLVVLFFRCKSRFFVISLKVLKWVDLQGATVKSRTI